VSQISILDPMFVQVLLTLSVLISLAVTRGRALHGKDCGRGNRHLAMGRAGWPDAAANLCNGVELPGLFYCVLAFALITRAADGAMIVLAWLFAAKLLVHAAIHVGPNDVRWRAPAFALGRRLVMIIGPKLALSVAMTGPSLPAPGLA
jgi:hypothetical protein